MGLKAEGAGSQRGPRRWDLSRESFDALLLALGPEREGAGEKYEAIRARLLRFFTWRGSKTPDELADETFDRVSRRLAEGETIRASDAGRYFLGVARNVLREAWDRDRRQGMGEAPDDRMARLMSPPPSPPDANEAALACLDRCLEALPPETRDLVLLYYDFQAGEQTRQRRELAVRLSIAPNALRIRLHRLRARLEDCVRSCLAARGETVPSAGPPMGEEARK